MSFKTCFTKILEINPHPDPETTALEIATVYGFNIVIRKDSMKVGDVVYFIPVDSMLPKELEEAIFPPESKIKLNDSRVRQIRIRKYPSQGLLVEASTICTILNIKPDNVKSLLEKDLSEDLGITKYEPPVREVRGAVITSKRRLAEHPQFHPYSGLTNIKWGDPFTEDELVSIQLKMHGTSAKFSNLFRKPRSLLQRLLLFLKLLPKYETRYGSNNVDITLKGDKSKNFYGEDVYGRAFKDCQAHERVKPNEVIYGEIVGEGIQKNYHYGHKTPTFLLFDVKIFKDEKDLTGTWLTPQEVETYARERGFKMVPVLYRGLYRKHIVESLVSGVDPYYPKHKVREGIVIKSQSNYNDVLSAAGKKSRKYVSPEYLDDKRNTDFH